MKKIIRYCLLVLGMFLFIRATCGKPKLSTKPMTGVEITDYVFFHNVSITFDGDHYFTLNGGNENYCVINEYDEDCAFIETYDVGLDGRTIFYNPKDKNLYVKIYGTDLWVIDLQNGTAGVRFSDIFEEDNSSPAFSPDGKYIYELTDGYVRVIDFKTGKELERFKEQTARLFNTLKPHRGMKSPLDIAVLEKLETQLARIREIALKTDMK